MELRRKQVLSRRHFCFCCMTGAAFAATGGWLTPRQAFAEARGLVTLIKDSAADFAGDAPQVAEECNRA